MYMYLLSLLEDRWDTNSSLRSAVVATMVHDLVPISRFEVLRGRGNYGCSTS
jgi:hypothetical protein